jgi:hypothetical protein
VIVGVLMLFHVFPETMVSSETLPSGPNEATASVYAVHFPLWLQVVFIGAIGLGLLLLLLPRREKTSA